MRIHGCQPSHGPCMPKIRPFIQDIELGGSGRVTQAAGPAAKAKHIHPFLRRKDSKPPQRWEQVSSQTMDAPPPTSPSSPSKSEGLYCCARRYYLPIIGASLPPSSPRVKLPFFPISSPLRHSCPICIFFAYYSPMFRLWSAYGMPMKGFWDI